MSEANKPDEVEVPVVVVNKNKKYRKEKPWDNDPTLDKWKVDEFKPEDNPNGVLEESSFAVLFP